MKYILNSKGEPQACDDLMTWAAWFEKADRQVCFTKVDNWIISTVFLGLNYNPFQNGPPVLWETMVFKNHESLWYDRCGGTREQAEAMHVRMVNKLNEEEIQFTNAISRAKHMI